MSHLWTPSLVQWMGFICEHQTQHRRKVRTLLAQRTGPLCPHCTKLTAGMRREPGHCPPRASHRQPGSSWLLLLEAGLIQKLLGPAEIPSTAPADTAPRRLRHPAQKTPFPRSMTMTTSPCMEERTPTASLNLINLPQFLATAT